ncbi:MAG: DUF6515 family protein [Candidatus Omnitrophica bacterium]|jgi:hypothetical protein|nr:DUF6515 family protein [Candidatus Omnitrophota bacterium]
MEDKRAIKIVVIAVLILIIAFTGSSQALAAKGPIHYRPLRHDRHPYWGRPAALSGMIAEAIIYAGRRLYCDRGYFYEEMPYGYIIVQAPVGMVIEKLPAGCKTVFVNNTRYYYYNNTYYTAAKKGYIVVEKPVYEVTIPYVVSYETEHGLGAEACLRQDAYTINIINSDATYTAIVLKKYKDGFTGPQGEWYPVFPSVEQLKLMYGK